MSYEHRDRHVSGPHVPRTQQGWVLLAPTYSSSQKIIPIDAFWVNQIPSLNIQLAPSLWELMSSLQNPRGKEVSSLLLSHLPPAAARPAHLQHKHLDRGGCSGVCLCYCTLRGCWVIQDVISAQRSRAKEIQKDIQQFWGAFSQLHSSLKLWEHKEVALIPKILFKINQKNLC